MIGMSSPSRSNSTQSPTGSSREFVADTGYVTVAERPLDPALFPDLAAEDLQPGALVFSATPGPVDLSDWRQWWRWSIGANWRHPFGPDSDLSDKADHPVVQVAYADTEAYANGRVVVSRTRPNGSMRREPAAPRPTPGARTSSLPGSGWRTPGRAGSRTRTPVPTAGSARLRSDRSRQ